MVKDGRAEEGNPEGGEVLGGRGRAWRCCLVAQHLSRKFKASRFSPSTGVRRGCGEFDGRLESMPPYILISFVLVCTCAMIHAWMSRSSRGPQFCILCGFWGVPEAWADFTP